jgi:hypothetical protein
MNQRSLSIIIATCIACGNTPQAIAYPELAAALLWIAAPYVGLRIQEARQEQISKNLKNKLPKSFHDTACGFINPPIIIETTLNRSTSFFVSQVYETKHYYQREDLGSGMSRLKEPKPSLTIEYPITITAFQHPFDYIEAISEVQKAAYLNAYEQSLTQFTEKNSDKK